LSHFGFKNPPHHVFVDNSHLYALLRPEFVRRYPVALSPDAFSRFQADSDEAQVLNQHVTEATESLIAELPRVASELCSKAIRLRSESIPITSLNISLELHVRGVNIKYLGKIYGRLETLGSKTDLCQLLLVEIIARTFKHIMVQKMQQFAFDHRRLCTEWNFSSLMVEYLNLLLGNHSIVDEFWESTVVPQAEDYFDLPSSNSVCRSSLAEVDADFDVLHHLLGRVCELLGIRFDAHFYNTRDPSFWKSESPFSVLGTLKLEPRVRSPALVASAQANACILQAKRCKRQFREQWFRHALFHTRQGLACGVVDPSLLIIQAEVLQSLGR